MTDSEAGASIRARGWIPRLAQRRPVAGSVVQGFVAGGSGFLAYEMFHGFSHPALVGALSAVGGAVFGALMYRYWNRPALRSDESGSMAAGAASYGGGSVNASRRAAVPVDMTPVRIELRLFAKVEFLLAYFAAGFFVLAAGAGTRFLPIEYLAVPMAIAPIGYGFVRCRRVFLELTPTALTYSNGASTPDSVSWGDIAAIAPQWRKRTFSGFLGPGLSLQKRSGGEGTDLFATILLIGKDKRSRVVEYLQSEADQHDIEISRLTDALTWGTSVAEMLQPRWLAWTRRTSH